MAVKAVLRENGFGNKVRVRTGKVRLSFPHLFDTYEKSGKYQAQFLIPKDSDTVKVLNEAIENAKADGKTRLWGGKVPGNLKMSVKDGDTMVNDDGESYPENEGCIIVTAKTNSKPAVFDTDGGDIFDQDDLYAGCYVQAIFDAYPYTNDSKGIAFALSGVKKVADGPRIGGGGYKAGAGDFSEVDDEDAEDLL